MSGDKNFVACCAGPGAQKEMKSQGWWLLDPPLLFPGLSFQLPLPPLWGRLKWSLYSQAVEIIVYSECLPR